MPGHTSDADDVHMGHLGRSGGAPSSVGLGDNDRTVAHRQLRPMPVADTEPLPTPEYLTQPRDRRPDIWGDDHRNNRDRFCFIRTTVRHAPDYHGREPPIPEEPIMARMPESQWREFLSAGTRTGKLATTRRDGRPHVVPVWFVLDGDDVVFNTGAASLKGRSLGRTGQASLCVDEQHPPYAFVTVSGPVTLSTDLDEMLPWATRIAARYMGESLAEQYGRRNAVDGELLVRLHMEHVLAVSHVSD
jgi:PPOX class probable F420-dependent enzyme